jgi:hypothetical protein
MSSPLNSCNIITQDLETCSVNFLGWKPGRILMYLFCCEPKESSDCFHLSCSEVCSFNIISLSWLTVGLWDGGSYFEKYGALTDAYMPKAIP